MPSWLEHRGERRHARGGLAVAVDVVAVAGVAAADEDAVCAVGERGDDEGGVDAAAAHHADHFDVGRVGGVRLPGTVGARVRAPRAQYAENPRLESRVAHFSLAPLPAPCEHNQPDPGGGPTRMVAPHEQPVEREAEVPSGLRRKADRPVANLYCRFASAVCLAVSRRAADSSGGGNRSGRQSSCSRALRTTAGE